MIITRTCPMCGNTTKKDLKITSEQINRYESTYDLIQNVFPNLTGAEREFYKTGYCDKCQDILFSCPWDD